MTDLDESQIAAYLRGDLDPDQRLAVEAALDRDPQWLAVVATMARENAALSAADDPGSDHDDPGSTGLDDPGSDHDDPGSAGLGSAGLVDGELPRASLAPGVRVGRFEVLRRIATGGMGVVHEAWDPTLERMVALKIGRRRPRDSAARARQLREARTLAQLSDPNVVAVFDAGEHDGRVYLAMERLEGGSLRAYLASHPLAPEAIVALFIQAARGLAAAHRKGIVHRDVKPANIVVEGERVVVVDFGLAKLELELETRPNDETTGLSPHGDLDSATAGSTGSGVSGGSGIAGTPAYMAPEQARGSPPSPRGDQYSLCVALAEALERSASPSAGPVRIPRRLRRIVDRGRALDPDDRYPDLDSLTAALEDCLGPARSRRRSRRALAVSAVGLTGLAAALGLALLPRPQVGLALPEDPCANADAASQQLWDDAARAQVEAAFARYGKPYLVATGEQVSAALDARTLALSKARVGLCRRLQAGRLSTEAEHRERTCLNRRQTELEVFLEVNAPALEDSDLGSDSNLGSASGSGSGSDPLDDQLAASRALAGLAKLPPASDCRPNAAGWEAPPLPAEPELRAEVERLERSLTRLDLLHEARRTPEATRLGRALLARAEALGHEPTAARAASSLAWILVTAGEHEEAEQLLDRALHAGERSGHDMEVARAWVRKVWAVGHIQARPEQGLEAAAHAEAWLARVGDPPALVFDLERHRGWIAVDMGEVEVARAAFARAAELATDPFEHALVENDLGVVQMNGGDLEGSQLHFKRASEALAGLLGERHPDVAKIRNNQAAITRLLGDYDGAQELFDLNLESFRAAYGERHELVGQTELNLAVLSGERGDLEAGLEHAAAATSIFVEVLGSEHPLTGRARASQAELLINLGQVEAGRALMLSAIADLRRALGENHPQLAGPHHNLGVALAGQGLHRAAIVEYETARRVLEQAYGPGHHDLSPVLTNLGLAHEQLGDDDSAEQLYRRAVDVAAPRDQPEANSRLGRLLVARARGRRAAREHAEGVALLELARTQHEQLGNAPLFIAQTNWALARALVEPLQPPHSAETRTRARKLAREAELLYREGDDLEAAAEVHAWLGEH